MSKRMIKIICMALSVCLIVLTSGCNSSKKPTETEVNTGGVTKERVTVIDESTDQLSFFKDGSFNFNIIVPDDYTDDQYHMVKETVFAKARSVNNKRPNIYRESSAKDNSLNNIYIGNTKSALSNETLNLINEDGAYFEEYVIMAKDGNIAINALNDVAVKNALDYFVNNILKDKDSTIGNKYTYHFQGSKNDNITINGIPISDYVINCTDRPQQMIYRGCVELQTAIKEATEYEVPILRGFDDKYKYRFVINEEGDDLNSYRVEVGEDSNVQVKGGHGYSVNAALHQLAKNIKASDSKKKLNIKSGTIISGSYDKDTYNTDGYKLVFSDEFNGTTLDPAWKCNEWESTAGRTKVVKDEWKVENGSLLLTSRKTTLETDGKPGYTGTEMFRNDFDFSYGYFEIRAKLSVGGGTQSAFWMKGLRDVDPMQPFAPEIDVFETFGSDTNILSCFHSWWNPDATIKGLKCTQAQQEAGHIQHLTENSPNLNGGMRHYPSLKANETSFADDWHTYGCEWTPAFIKYFCDGIEYASINIDASMKDPVTGELVSEYLMLTSGTTGNLYLSHAIMEHELVEPVNEKTQYPSKFYIDYMHLYQVDTFGVYKSAK